jgi:hypothetical protein
LYGSQDITASGGGSFYRLESQTSSLTNVCDSYIFLFDRKENLFLSQSFSSTPPGRTLSSRLSRPRRRRAGHLVVLRSRGSARALAARPSIHYCERSMSKVIAVVPGTPVSILSRASSARSSSPRPPVRSSPRLALASASSPRAAVSPYARQREASGPSLPGGLGPATPASFSSSHASPVVTHEALGPPVRPGPLRRASRSSSSRAPSARASSGPLASAPSGSSSSSHPLSRVSPPEAVGGGVAPPLPPVSEDSLAASLAIAASVAGGASY